MSNTKKTLVVKLSYDVTGTDNAALELIKMAMRVQCMAQGIKEDQIDFELLYSNEENRVLQLLQSVRSEFKVSDAEIAEAEKSDGYQEFLSLFNSIYGDEEAEDEITYDEE